MRAVTKLARTAKGRVTHAIKEPIDESAPLAGWYASHGWHFRSACGELVGRAIGEGEPTCKDCAATLERERDRYRPIRKAIEELEVLLAAVPVEEELPRELRWRLHVLAANRNDYTFWVESVGRRLWRAIEIETGVPGSTATSPKGAMDNYWKEHS